VRHIKFGEGDYDVAEKMIRQLLTAARPGVTLPPRTENVATTPQSGLTPETYFGVGKVVNYRGAGTYDEGSHDFAYPPSLPDDSFALRGRWSLDYQGATAETPSSTIALNCRAKNVYLVVGGTGTVAVTHDGVTDTVQVNEPPTAHRIVAADDVRRGGSTSVRTTGYRFLVHLRLTPSQVRCGSECLKTIRNKRR
jgi:Thioredoxin like C-terminal domain